MSTSENRFSQDKKRPAAPITEEGAKPKKQFYRQRAHCNPLSHNDSFQYPLRPELINWGDKYFPGIPEGSAPSVLDIGCGFGGLTLALATILPDQVVLGMEIRAKVRAELCFKQQMRGHV